VIFVAYGMSESFGGPGGVEPFVVQLDKMLDMLSRTQARMVLLSPIRHEDLGRPLPDPADHNRDLASTSTPSRRSPLAARSTSSTCSTSRARPTSR
jgi:hypothetical protein